MPDLPLAPEPATPARHLAPVPVDSPSRRPPLTPTPIPPLDGLSRRSTPPPAAAALPPAAPAAGREQPAEDAGLDPNRWKALAVCLVAVFMTLLDVSIVNVALPDLAGTLHASSADLQWILSGYALTFGLVLVPAGRLGDLYGRRTAFLVSVTAFVAASALCGIAPNATFLVVSRLAQGIAAGALTPQVSGLIQQLFSGRERGRAFGYFGAIAGVSTAVGPLLGGLLILAGGTATGWRLVFYVNLPFGLVALFFAYRLLPRGVARPQAVSGRAAFDPVGTLLLGFAVVAVLLPLVEERQWPGWHKWLLLPVAAVLALAFVAWERRVGRRGGAPAVDLALFTKRAFALGNLVGLLYFAGFTATFFIFTVFLQDGHGYPPWEAGLASTPFAVAGILTSRVAGRRASRMAPRLLQLGSMLFCAGFAAALLVLRHGTTHHIAGWLAVPLFVAGLGNGLLLPANQTSSLSAVPVRQAGVGGAVFQTSLRIGTALGIAVVASAFYRELAESHGDYSRALQRGYAVAIVFGALAFLAALAQELPSVRARTEAAGVGG